MALKVDNMNLNNGLVLENCYVKVESVSGTKEDLSFNMKIFVNEQARVNNKSWIDERQYNFTPDIGEDSENFIKQSYEYLKSLDDFKNSIDC